MKKLEYKISIACPKSKVWDIMLKPETYVLWIKDSWPDSFYEGKWELNTEIKFISENGEGTLAFIEALQLYNYIVAKHIAILGKNGAVDQESDFAKKWMGTRESYSFSETNGITELTVVIDTNPEWVKMFDEGWPKALQQLKAICEKK